VDSLLCLAGRRKAVGMSGVLFSAVEGSGKSNGKVLGH
jgi:hypothetical protein